MNADFEFIPSKGAYQNVLDRMAGLPKITNLIRMAMSLGACIAGGAAISVLQNHLSVGKRMNNWKDIDFWFPNRESLDAFLISAKMDPDVSYKSSFGGHALDFVVREKMWSIPIQAIMFRTGDPVQIISQFDFKNCACAIVPDGFWIHKDVPDLMKTSKLALLNDNSAFFLSRVEKYIKKGFVDVDSAVKRKVWSELDRLTNAAIQACKDYSPDTTKPLAEFDYSYKDHKKVSSRTLSLIYRFAAMHKASSESGFGLFSAKQLEEINEKEQFLLQFQETVGNKRRESYNLPYGYYSDPSKAINTIDELFVDI